MKKMGSYFTFKNKCNRWKDTFQWQWLLSEMHMKNMNALTFLFLNFTLFFNALSFYVSNTHIHKWYMNELNALYSTLEGLEPMFTNFPLLSFLHTLTSLKSYSSINITISGPIYIVDKVVKKPTRESNNFSLLYFLGFFLTSFSI